MPSAEMLAAIDRLNDATCAHARATGRSYVIILAPSQADEPILRSQDGKPLICDATPERMLEVVRMERGEEPAR